MPEYIVTRKTDGAEIYRYNADAPIEWSGMEFADHDHIESTPIVTEDTAPVDPSRWRIYVGSFFDRFGTAKLAILSDPDPVVQAVIKDASVRNYSVEFSEKKVAERVRVGVDFVRLLAAGESIVSAVVVASVLRGVDAAPAGLLNGACSVAGSNVWQELKDGVAGVYYTLEFAATTNLGHVLIERATQEVIA